MRIELKTGEDITITFNGAEVVVKPHYVAGLSQLFVEVAEGSFVGHLLAMDESEETGYGDQYLFIKRDSEDFLHGVIGPVEFIVSRMEDL